MNPDIVGIERGVVHLQLDLADVMVLGLVDDLVTLRDDRFRRWRLLRGGALGSCRKDRYEQECRERCAHSTAVFEGYHELLRHLDDVAEQKDRSGNDDAW
jgi:hypothetical protein